MSAKKAQKLLAIAAMVSLSWEPGLYGNKSDLSGYNLESEEYRGVAYASCEFNGQDMFLNNSAICWEQSLPSSFDGRGWRRHDRVHG